ncbi:hypothetical protein DPMN_109544 [Dreissena polymorpha]|uniref:Ig-like domain-containing protein n=1 Tax=Dreissena polymorpha TaxID=45954 RepID=A0A9D4QM96_DREPO|nr:hypothetical protein DPMN_109544 [Dreissena polymorpha]
MRRLVLLFLMPLLSLVAGDVGFTTEDEWAYQWYENEPFTIRCAASMPLFDNLTVTWAAPGEEGLLTTASVSQYYEVRSSSNVSGSEIYVKSVTPSVHGIYVCHVHTEDGEFYNKSIFALNYRDVKYHSMGTKYRRNVIVAVISSVVFLVPLFTLCLLHEYSWEKRHPEYKAMSRGKSQEMKLAYEGKHDYINNAFQTQL